MAGAAELYAAVLTEEPAQLGALAGMAKLHLDAADLEGAKGFLALVPAEKIDDPAFAAIRAAIELAEKAAEFGDIVGMEARIAADPKDHQQRFDLAIALNAANRREEAVDHMIFIIKADRKWRDDEARKQLLQFFEAWGPMDDDAVSGRRKLSTALFS